MPLTYARDLMGRHRTARADRHLGFALAFVAGATNAGGFLAVKQYTSHMTGIVSAMADDLALGAYGLVLTGAEGLTAFVSGAACSAAMILYGRRRQMQAEYALPLLLEAALLLCFGLLGTWLSAVDGLLVHVTVMLLCFTMGLQNAVVTKLSRAEIRTTHITGVVTDIGIELGRMAYRSVSASASIAASDVAARRGRLAMLTGLASSFVGGGVIGAFGFKHLGYLSTVPLALALITLACVPAVDDLAVWLRRRRSE